MLIRPLYSVFRDTVLRLWNLFWGDTRQKTLSNVKIRPEVLDIFNDILEDSDFQFQDISERVYEAEHIDLAARCLAAGGQQGKLVIKLKPFKKVCPISTHIYCQ